MRFPGYLKFTGISLMIAFVFRWAEISAQQPFQIKDQQQEALQENYFIISDYKALKESYFRLNDSILKAETGSFTFVGSLMGMDTNARLREFQMNNFTHDSLWLVLNDIKILLASSRFRTFEHSLGFIPGENYLYSIDEQPYWGIDGRVPYKKIDSVVVYFEERELALPLHAFSDLYEPNLCRKKRFLFFRERLECKTTAFLSADGSRLYIHMTNGRWPLLYEVTWIIRNQRYVGRILDYSQ